MKSLAIAKMSVRFTFLDALRGLAALAVVLFHSMEGHHIPALQAAMPSWLEFLIGHGNVGVAVFFVLSGFVISHSLYAERVTPSLAGRFMLRRSLRLDPPYWVAIAIAIGFAVLSAKIVPNKGAPDISTAQIIAHIFYVQDILGYPNINTVFWTLCLEVQFYLIYVSMLVLAKNNPDLPFQGKPAIAILIFAMALSLLWPTGLVASGFWPGSFLPLWHGFLLGVGAYWSWRNPRLAPFFLAFAAIVFGFSLGQSNAFSLVCAFTACLLWGAAVTNRLEDSLRNRGFQFLGMISYSLYLIHNPVTGASFRVGYILTNQSLWWEAVWWAGSVGACVVFATAMWWMVERPSIRLAHQVRLR